MPDYMSLAEKLLKKTRERKIDWKGTFDSKIFIAVVDEGYSFETTYTPGIQDHCSLEMKDGEAARVFRLSAGEPTANSSPENDSVFQLLKTIWDEARTKALKIDEKLSHISNILDKL